QYFLFSLKAPEPAGEVMSEKTQENSNIMEPTENAWAMDNDITMKTDHNNTEKSIVNNKPESVASKDRQ
ncbi:19208_t:CDS:2, partial [Gigaspora rosea]